MAGNVPNILLVVADQLAPQFLPAYGHKIVQTPNLDRIAEGGTVFDAAYTNSPLCVPARAGLFTGRLPSRIGVYDTASDFATSIPTMGHVMRNEGFHTVLAGKCHFIGPDQLHGFEDRTTTDICPAEMVMFAHWERDGESPLGWYHDFNAVVNSGIAERSTQQDHDFATAYTARQWLYDWRRNDERRPFFMHLSFSHPHDPYVTPRKYWERYREAEIDMPVTPYIPLEERDAYSAWLYRHYDRGEIAVTEEDIRRARHGYYGNISLVDDLIGEVLETLDAIRERDNTIILVTADHGEMLGERGQWYKMSPFERSSRVPMIVNVPGGPGGGRSSKVVSLVDLLPTILSLATDGAKTAPDVPVDGRDFSTQVTGDDLAVDDPDRADHAIVEFFFEGLTEPAAMIRRGAYKFVRVDRENELLFNIANDPEERKNLSADPDHTEIAASLAATLAGLYDYERLRDAIVESQDRRALVLDALLKGRRESWAFQPYTDASKQFYRTHRTWLEQEAADFLRFDRT